MLKVGHWQTQPVTRTTRKGHAPGVPGMQCRQGDCTLHLTNIGEHYAVGAKRASAALYINLESR
jgi:hypothetical protein